MHEEVQKFLFNFLIGGTASALTKTFMAPVDRVKLLMQNQNSVLQLLKGEAQPYQGIFDTIRRIPKEQGYRSFWRGNAVNVMRTFPQQALSFAFYDTYLYLFKYFRLDSVEHPRHSLQFISGGLAGATMSVVTYPLEFCQTRIAADIGSDFKTQKKLSKREFTGLTSCLTGVYNSEGFRGYYTGVSMNVPGVFIYRSLYFGLYDLIKRNYTTKFSTNISDENIPIFARFLIAQVSTVTSGFVSYPFDTVCRRMMLDAARSKELQLFHHSSWYAIKLIYKKEGLKSFYRGEVMNVFRSVGAALVLVLYDVILHGTEWKKKIVEKKEN